MVAALFCAAWSREFSEAWSGQKKAVATLKFAKFSRKDNLVAHRNDDGTFTAFTASFTFSNKKSCEKYEQAAQESVGDHLLSPAS